MCIQLPDFAGYLSKEGNRITLKPCFNVKIAISAPKVEKLWGPPQRDFDLRLTASFSLLCPRKTVENCSQALWVIFNIVLLNYERDIQIHLLSHSDPPLNALRHTYINKQAYFLCRKTKHPEFWVPRLFPTPIYPVLKHEVNLVGMSTPF